MADAPRPRADLSRLISAVAPLDLDPEQLAEMLWLAKHIQDAEGGYAESPELEGTDQSDHGPPPDPVDPHEADVEVVATAPIHTQPAPVGDRPGAAVGMPFPPALELSRLLRELRPLARRAPDPDHPVFDEQASVELTAATGVAWPATSPGRVRNREVALVLDRHPSMSAWEGLASEVRSLLESVGGFRRVAAWYLDESQDGRLMVGTRPGVPGDRPISTLRDPTGQRIVMVLTAALGDSWSWGTAQADLAGLAESSPVVIAQPLPSRLWRRTGLDSAMGRLSSSPGGEPAPLKLLPSQAPAGALPIPVLQLAEGWLGPFAGLATGVVAHARFPLALRQPITPVSERRTVASRQQAELGSDPVERIRRFRSASSPEAYRLAAYLSIPQLALPVMRLILRTAVPKIDPSALAEVLCGGLLTTQSTAAPYSVPEELREFAYPEPIRQVLRQTVRRSEARDILRATQEFMLDTYDVSSVLFRATLSTPSDLYNGHPFALIPLSRLLSLAPDFASVVDPEEWEDYDVVISAAGEARSAPAIDEALAALRRALRSLREGNPTRDSVLRGMAELLSRRYATSGDLADLDEAIVASKAALADSDDPSDRAEPLAALARILVLRFEASDEVDYLIDAVRVLRAAATYLPDEHPRRAQTAERLADALLRLGERSNDPAVLMNAVEQFAVAAELAKGVGHRGVVELKAAQVYLLLSRVAAYADTSSLAGRVAAELRKALRDASPSEEYTLALERLVDLAGDSDSRLRVRVAEILSEQMRSPSLEHEVLPLFAAAAERLAEPRGNRAR